MSDNFRKKQYEQSAPIPAKFLMPDGSISDELPGGGGSGGTTDYTELENKPRINNVELSGNKSAEDLGLSSKEETDEKIAVINKTINDNWQGNGYNLLPFAYKDSSKTVNGITFTVNSDGSITANGTATASMWFNVIEHDDMPNFEIGKTYRLSGCPSGGGNTTYFLKPRNAGGSEYDIGNGYIFTHSADITDYLVTIRFQSGVVCDNVVFKPMIVEVSDDGSYPTEYQRYAMGNVELTDKVSNIQEPTVTWVNCTPLSQGTYFQAKNGVAYLSAHLNNVSITANTWKRFGAIPEGFRPNKTDIRFPVLIDGSTKACKGHITNTGVIDIYSNEEITEGSSAFVFNLSYIIG